MGSSIMEVGGEAIALGSAANGRALLKLLETQKPVQPLIIALDNDSAGEKAERSLWRACNGNIPIYRLNLMGITKTLAKRYRLTERH